MPSVIWFYGISGSGKTTAARIMHEQLLAVKYKSVHLDADHLRKTFWPELGFNKDGRLENTKRITLLAKEFNDNGMFVVVSAVAAYTSQRIQTLSIIPNTKFIFISTPINICKKRKPQFYGDTDDNKIVSVESTPHPWAVLDGTQGVSELYSCVSKLKLSII